MRSNTGTFPYVDSDGTVWLAFSDWGEGKRDKILMCVHGLTRQSRDFDYFADSLSDSFRIIEVDLVGHGKSGWLANKQGYTIENYMRHIDGLMGYRGISQMDWLGTFTGGVMGILLASREDTPIRRLILNDIGAYVSAASIKKFLNMLGPRPVFNNLGETEKYFRKVYSGIGVVDDSKWSHFIIHSIIREPDRSYSLHYDPEVLSELEPIDVWDAYDKIKCPVLLLRGEESELLDRGAAESMMRRGPKARLVELSECGHAPSLMTEDQISVIRDWLKETDEATQESSKVDDGGT
ncbi:MAG: alpha/beta hydrolase [Rhodospirillaceae bacterium]|nr:alpha/beta hydrolase [Rhodospirillaceae bacterium]|tara:strand:- start:1838 stop:2719 length:882 start_codon:yes stop_codon:yes gene_type:complete